MPTTNTVLITASGAGTFHPPADCPVGTQINIETWGGGSGGSGNAGSGHWGAAGSGATYANNVYILNSADITNGISYTIAVGSAGTSGADPVNGGNTIFGVQPKNWIPNSNGLGAILNTANALPYGWDPVPFTGSNVIPTIVGQGLVTPASGTCSGVPIPYTDIQIAGTVNSGNGFTFAFTTSLESTAFGYIPCKASSSYTMSAYFAITVGLTNYTANVGSGTNAFTSFFNNYSNAQGGFLTNTSGGNLTLNGTLTQFQFNDTSPATANVVQPTISWASQQGNVVNFVLRVAGLQFEQNSTATILQTTPTSYVLAIGANHPVGNTQSNFGNPAMQSFGSGLQQGGSGHAQDGNADSGGGAAGPDGPGLNGGTGSAGGSGDNGSGGTGGAPVFAGGTGNPGSNNVLGGGGGGGVSGGSGTGGYGGYPGAGGGGVGVITSTGGNGANGQIRITYIPNTQYLNTYLDPEMFKAFII